MRIAPFGVARFILGCFLSGFILCLAMAEFSYCQDDRPGNYAKFEGFLIDSVIIENRNIYNTDLPEYDNVLFKTANKLHYRTREGVIKKELLLNRGGKFSSELADETARNLRTRLTLFDAWIEVGLLTDSSVFMRVITIDDWSLVGGLEYDQGGGESSYRLRAEERNLLGRNIFFAADYVVRDPEKDYAVLRYRSDRFNRRPLAILTEYSGNPQNSYSRLDLYRPYYNLSQRTAFGVDMKKYGGRRDLYRDDLRISETEYDGDQLQLAFEYRFGTYKNRLKILYYHEYRFQKTTSFEILSPNHTDSLSALASILADSVSHLDKVEVEFSRTGYWKTERIDGYGYNEDFAIGHAFGIGYGRTFRPDYKSYIYDLIDFHVGFRHRFGSNLLWWDYTRTFWLKRSIDFRRTSQLTVRYYNNAVDFLTVALRGRFVRDWRRDTSDPLVLGEHAGLRGFERFFQTGDRLAVVNLETRFFTGIRFLSLILGGALFTDIGRTWKENESFSLTGYSASFGAGLRIHLERAARGHVIRTDFSYSKENGWQVSVGSGQYFSAGGITF